MGQVVLIIPMDEDVKNEFERICAEAGMSAADAINMFARAVIRNKCIPYELIGSDPFYSAKNQARLKDAMEQLEAGHGVEHELIETEE